MLVLVVDDDARLRRLLCRLLGTYGFDSVHPAGDGEVAFDLAQSLRPDLILTDYNMPRLNGLGLVRRLRACGDRTPVLMLSGESDPRLIATALLAGVAGFLAKPLNPDALAERIRATLGVRRLAA